MRNSSINKQYMFRFSSELMEQVDAFADEKLMTRSDVVRMALVLLLKEMKSRKELGHDGVNHTRKG